MDGTYIRSVTFYILKSCIGNVVFPTKMIEIYFPLIRERMLYINVDLIKMEYIKSCTISEKNDYISYMNIQIEIHIFLIYRACIKSLM